MISDGGPAAMGPWGGPRRRQVSGRALNAPLESFGLGVGGGGPASVPFGAEARILDP